MHKKKNPLRVLSGELVLNFRKSGAKMRPSNVVKSAMSERVVRECCEREIVNGIGATTEAIHHSLVPRLLEADLLERFSREHGDITPVLEENFDFEADSGRWHLRMGVTPSARLTDRQLARYYLRRFLSIRSKKGRPPTEAEVSRHVNSRLKNGRSVNSERMRRLLRDEAYTPDDRHWRLNGDDLQREFLFAQ